MGHLEARAREALARAAADPSATRELDLSGANLPAFPPEIFACDGLEVLRLHGAVRMNIVSADGRWRLEPQHLPAELGRLRRLRELHLGHLALAELPEWIGELAALETLSLYDNKLLTRLPSSMTRLSELRELSLGSIATLTELPEELGELRKLESLDLRGSGVTSVPESLAELTRLCDLRLPNGVDRLPARFGALRALESLRASSHALRSVADELPALTRLEVLVVDNHEQRPDESLPESIGDLRSLEELDASFVGLTSLPDLSRLGALVELRVIGNRLSELSGAIGRLPALRRLAYTDNPLPAVEKRRLEAMMDAPPAERAAMVGRPPPRLDKPPKSTHLGQIVSINNSILLLIGDADVAARWQGVEGATSADGPEGSDWHRAFAAIHGEGRDEASARVPCGDDTLLALSIHVGGIVDVFRVDDRVVLVEGLDDEARKSTSFKRWVGAPPADAARLGTIAIPSGALAGLPSPSPGAGLEAQVARMGKKRARSWSTGDERAIVVGVTPGDHDVYLEEPVVRSWGEAARVVVSPSS